MKTKFLAALLALLFGVAPALALTGNPPLQYGAPALIDQTWLYALSGGANYVYQSGFTAVGTTQATALQLPTGVFMLEVDTSNSAGTSGVALPPCIAGTQMIVNNNTAYTVTIYPSIANNPITAAQDTINNTTSLSTLTYTEKQLTCAKNGVWGAK